MLEYERSLHREGKTDYTIEEYFRLLPFQVIALASDLKERDAILKSQDQQRKATGPCVNELEQLDGNIGYLRFACRAERQTSLVEIAAWKRNGLPDLIGVNITSIGTNMSSDARFFEFKDGDWLELTDLVFPKLTAADFGGEGVAPLSLYVQFSQFDRNINVQPANPLPVGAEKIMGARRTLKWSDGRFTKS